MGKHAVSCADVRVQNTKESGVGFQSFSLGENSFTLKFTPDQARALAERLLVLSQTCVDSETGTPAVGNLVLSGQPKKNKKVSIFRDIV